MKRLDPAGTIKSAAGISCLLFGFIFLVLSDATAKWLTETHPVTEIVAIRALLVVSIIALIHAARRQLAVLRPYNIRLQMRRAILASGSVYLFIFGVSYVALAEAAAAAYIGPIVMTAIAPAMLAERVGVHRWSAVLLGFVGMLIMLRPSPQGLNWAMLLPASAAVFGALRDITTRQMRSSEHPIAVLFFSNCVVAALGFTTAAWGWRGFDSAQLVLLLVSAALIGGAHFLHIQAFRLEEASVLAPFRYTGIVWAIIFGFIFWGDLPDRWVVAGAIIVIASGLYIYHRERR